MDTPTVLLGVEFYADPVTQRALNTRASILTQVIENYVISKVTGEPYYGEEEWILLPDNIKLGLERLLKELEVKPYGRTSKESSIQMLTKGEVPEYDPTTGTLKVYTKGKKGVTTLMYFDYVITQVMYSVFITFVGAIAASPLEPDDKRSIISALGEAFQKFFEENVTSFGGPIPSA
ncbi:hypothetical protein [Methanopyrus kandleri]|uniref:Uncharacterized protein n=1 Tax=Methanopyrus kandleri TaxID=2320 RepID=A0A832WNL3_9EURY|nr:hypothetical protein [Methanopyrus kandleri]HII69784.1 hypothetical protein [Methanopyrus kandleri]